MEKGRTFKEPNKYRTREGVTMKKPDWIIIPCTDMEITLSKFTEWEKDRVKLNFPEGTVNIVATFDPDLPWAVEVATPLFEAKEGDVWE